MIYDNAVAISTKANQIDVHASHVVEKKWQTKKICFTNIMPKAMLLS